MKGLQARAVFLGAEEMWESLRKIFMLRCFLRAISKILS